jgi:hypothetical protein
MLYQNSNQHESTKLGKAVTFTISQCELHNISSPLLPIDVQMVGATNEQKRRTANRILTPIINDQMTLIIFTMKLMSVYFGGFTTNQKFYH